MKSNLKSEEKVEHQFDTFMKKVLRNKARDIYAENRRLNEKEISLDQLNEVELDVLCTYDNYETEHVNFHTHGYTISIKDALLAEAITCLSEQQQDIVLLSFFLGQHDIEIAIIMGIPRSTFSYKKIKALEELRKLMKEMLS